MIRHERLFGPLLKAALENKITQRQTIVDSIVNELKEARERVLVSSRRVRDCPDDWLRQNVYKVRDLLDSVIPADPEEATLFTENSRASSESTANFLATSDGLTYDRSKIRRELKDMIVPIHLARTMAEVVDWEHRRVFYKLDDALDIATAVAEQARHYSGE